MDSWRLKVISQHGSGVCANMDLRKQKTLFHFLEESTGGRPATDYQITIEMAKEIAMIQRNEKGKQARQYFIQLKMIGTARRKLWQGLYRCHKENYRY